MSYARPAGASKFDREEARLFEEEVGTWLGPHRISYTNSTDRLDHWVPGFYLEVKEKKGPLSARWTEHWPGVPPEELFVLDELSVRKAAEFFPHCYFVLRDRPGGMRLFLARIDEIFCAERVRLNRVGPTGHPKGKWLLDLRSFRRFEPEHLRDLILQDQISTPWKASHCLSQMEVPEV